MTLEEQDRAVAEAMERDGSRLRGFIRRRVLDDAEAEDVLQDVFYELVQAYRLMKPVEEATAWMFRVARNRVIDLFRRRGRAVSLETPVSEGEGAATLEDLLPSREAGPDAEFARGVLLEELEEAIAELPEEQRDVFVAHELEGESFKAMSARTGVGMNTLLARKRYAVLRLRKRLAEVRGLVEER